MNFPTFLYNTVLSQSGMDRAESKYLDKKAKGFYKGLLKEAKRRKKRKLPLSVEQAGILFIV